MAQKKFGSSYNQETGTFTSQDPLGLASGEINLYGSRRNNPLKYLDPNGQNPLLIAIAAGATAQGLTSFATEFLYFWAV